MAKQKGQKDKQHSTEHYTEDKRTNNNLQNITHKTTDRVTRTPLKTEGELTCSYIYVIQVMNHLYI